MFAFENESQIARRLDGFRAYNVRPGHLITLLVKALQMTLVELHMDDDGTERDCDAALSLLAPHTCILPEKRARKQPAATADASSTKMEVDGDPPRSAASSAKKEKKKQQRQRDKQRKRAQQQQQKESPAKPIIPEDGESMDVDEIDHDDEGIDLSHNCSSFSPLTCFLMSQLQRMPLSKFKSLATHPKSSLPRTPSSRFKALTSDTMSARGTQYTQTCLRLGKVSAQVSLFSTHPNSSGVAHRSLDSIVALWQLPNTNGRITDPNLIKHPSDLPGNQVTCIAWSPNGEYLATGTKDAKTRIFTRKGNLVLTFSHGAEKNSNPVFALAFNPDSTLLASGCASGTIIVWDVRQDAEKYSSSAHTGAVMAFDWYNHHLLASGASDSTIRLSDVNKGSQTCWSGHTADVNDIKWDPSRKYLASCSDDCTVCIWSRERPGSEPVAVLRGHEKPVLTIDWNPKPPNNVPQLASYVFSFFFLFTHYAWHPNSKGIHIRLARGQIHLSESGMC